MALSFVGLAALALWQPGGGERLPDPVAAAVEPTAEAAAAADPLQLLLNDDFVDNRMGWRDMSASTTWLEDAKYRLETREPSRFVAVGAPLTIPLADVVVSARFRKLGGPTGGGYGVIVRDQEPARRDGVNQDGRFYVLEIGDRGEVGIWRRDGGQWIDLLPWTTSDAVHPGEAVNEVAVAARGSRLSLIVNGVQVASHVDDALSEGGVGVFVGGDGNRVALERFTVRTPGTQGWVAPRAVPTAPPVLPITRVTIPSIGLDSEAVPAELIQQPDGTTWEVPAHKVGHARGTAGAGGEGNAVLVGHVDSRGLGNVFEDIHTAQVGELITVFSGDQQFEYSIVDIRRVPRDYVDVVKSTDVASVTLITCTGLWLPHVADYAERLIVRAELPRR